MRAKNIYIIVIKTGENSDQLDKSGRGLFFKYARKNNTAKVELWAFDRKKGRGTSLAEWTEGKNTEGYEIKSDEEVEKANERSGVGRCVHDAGAIIVTHGSPGTIAGLLPASIGQRIGAWSKKQKLPHFSKIVLEVCRSATDINNPVIQDPTSAQQFLKAYADAYPAAEGKTFMIAGYDAAISVAYKDKPGMPEDDDDSINEADPEYRMNFGKKYVMKGLNALRGDKPAWVSNVRGDPTRYLEGGNRNIKRAFNYVVKKDNNDNYATEIALDAWSDRE